MVRDGVRQVGSTYGEGTGGGWVPASSPPMQPTASNERKTMRMGQRYAVEGRGASMGTPSPPTGRVSRPWGGSGRLPASVLGLGPRGGPTPPARGFRDLPCRSAVNKGIVPGGIGCGHLDECVAVMGPA